MALRAIYFQAILLRDPVERNHGARRQGNIGTDINVHCRQNWGALEHMRPITWHCAGGEECPGAAASHASSWRSPPAPRSPQCSLASFPLLIWHLLHIYGYNMDIYWKQYDAACHLRASPCPARPCPPRRSVPAARGPPTGTCSRTPPSPAACCCCCPGPWPASAPEVVIVVVVVVEDVGLRLPPGCRP